MNWLLVALALLSLGSCQEKNSTLPRSSPVSESVDHFIGVWKRDRQKSLENGRQPVFHYFFSPNYELIAIERQGSNFRFTYTSSDDKGGKHERRFMTDMKGPVVWATMTDGKPTKPALYMEDMRVTRKDSDSFVEAGSVFLNEYTVLSDGRTMTLHHTPYVDNERDRVLVFQRVR